MCAEFALGKAYADIGAPGRAFAHWLSGNARKRRQIDYDADAIDAKFAAFEQVLTSALFDEKRGNGDPSTVPIFIVGMPRSGITLIEQILSNHPAVHGTGELTAFDDILHDAIETSGKPSPYPQCVRDLDAKTIRAIGRRYPVHTASASQVRQPIYNRSIGRWRAYEPWLGQLVAALGPSAP